MTEQIKNEILKRYEEGCTDSDIYDWAEEFEISVREIDYLIASENTKGTVCEGCDYVTMGYFSLMRVYPCSECRRGRKDYYKKRKEM